MSQIVDWSLLKEIKGGNRQMHSHLRAVLGRYKGVSLTNILRPEQLSDKLDKPLETGENPATRDKF